MTIETPPNRKSFAISELEVSVKGDTVVKII